LSGACGSTFAINLFRPTDRKSAQETPTVLSNKSGWVLHRVSGSLADDVAREFNAWSLPPANRNRFDEPLERFLIGVNSYPDLTLGNLDRFSDVIQRLIGFCMFVGSGQVVKD
jgi:hypothetical protein